MVGEVGCLDPWRAYYALKLVVDGFALALMSKGVEVGEWGQPTTDELEQAANLAGYYDRVHDVLARADEVQAAATTLGATVPGDSQMLRCFATGAVLDKRLLV